MKLNGNVILLTGGVSGIGFDVIEFAPLDLATPYRAFSTKMNDTISAARAGAVQG